MNGIEIVCNLSRRRSPCIQIFHGARIFVFLFHIRAFRGGQVGMSTLLSRAFVYTCGRNQRITRLVFLFVVCRVFCYGQASSSKCRPKFSLIKDGLQSCKTLVSSVLRRTPQVACILWQGVFVLNMSLGVGCSCCGYQFADQRRSLGRTAVNLWRFPCGHPLAPALSDIPQRLIHPQFLLISSN